MAEDEVVIPEGSEKFDYDKAMERLAAYAADSGELQNNIMRWRMANENRYLPGLLGAGHDMMAAEGNRPETMFVSGMFNPKGMSNRQRVDYGSRPEYVEFDEGDKIIADEGGDPPGPPPTPWTPPPGYMVPRDVLTPKTDDEIFDAEAIYGGSQGRLPYGAISTDDDELGAWTAPADYMRGPILSAIDDSNEYTNWIPPSDYMKGPIMGTTDQTDEGAGVVLPDNYMRGPVMSSTDQGEDLSLSLPSNYMQGPILSATDQGEDLSMLMPSNYMQGPIMSSTDQGDESRITADLDLWRDGMPEATSVAGEDVYSRDAMMGSDAGLAAYGGTERPEVGGIYGADAAFDPRDAMAAYGSTERIEQPAALSIYDESPMAGLDMAMSAYNMPGMSMGATAGGGGGGGGGADGGGVDIIEGMQDFTNENPQLMGQANLIPSSLGNFIEANTGVSTRGMTAVQFDDWLNGRDVVVQGEVIPSDPVLIARLRAQMIEQSGEERTNSYLGVLSTWATQHREDDYKRQGGASGAAAGGIDIGIGDLLSSLPKSNPYEDIGDMSGVRPEAPSNLEDLLVQRQIIDSQTGGGTFKNDITPPVRDNISLADVGIRREGDIPQVEKFKGIVGRYPTSEEWNELYAGNPVLDRGLVFEPSDIGRLSGEEGTIVQQLMAQGQSEEEAISNVLRIRNR